MIKGIKDLRQDKTLEESNRRPLQRKKKKKGFTLIELVVVLAVIAIISFIAIPNLTKVRNESKIKADARSIDQIEKIVLMSLASEEIEGPIDFDITFEGPEPQLSKDFGPVFKENFKRVTKPQGKGRKGYRIFISDNEEVGIEVIGNDHLSPAEAKQELNN